MKRPFPRFAGPIAFMALVGLGAAAQPRNGAQPKTVAQGRTVAEVVGAPEQPAEAARAALKRLKEGNQRFVAGTPTHPRQDKNSRAQLARGQQPFAIVLGCSDSRVPPELLFDQGLGDLFVIRVAGNVVNSDVQGSIEYGIVHLKAPLVVVLGHENCGAVTAALSPGTEKEPKAIQMLLKGIEPALAGVDTKLGLDQRVQAGVEANVRWSIKQITESPKFKERFGKKAEIIGAVYELKNGNVRFLEAPKGQGRLKSPGPRTCSDAVWPGSSPGSWDTRAN